VEKPDAGLGRKVSKKTNFLSSLKQQVVMQPFFKPVCTSDFRKLIL